MDLATASVIASVIAAIGAIIAAIITARLTPKIYETHRQTNVNGGKSNPATLLDLVGESNENSKEALSEAQLGNLIATATRSELQDLRRRFDTHVLHSDEMDGRLIRVEHELQEDDAA